MKRKFNFGRLGALALALTLITTSLMGGTLAKYTTQAAGTGTATVAKWAFKAGSSVGADAFAENSLNLSDTANSAVEAGKIAPGSEGILPIYVDLTGTEVATKIEVAIKFDDLKKLPSQLSFKDSEGNAIDLKDATNDTNVIVLTKELSETDAKTYKEDLSIKWAWAFEGDDTADTTIGKDPGTANLTITVTGTQLSSNPTTP